MKYLVYLIKKICIGIFALYSVNILFSTLNILIPINIFTISVSSCLGFFGIVALIVLKFII